MIVFFAALLGAIFGAVVGVFLMALLVASSGDDDEGP